MSILEIKKELPIKEVAANLAQYRFNQDTPVSVEQLSQLINHIVPSDFSQLQYSNILQSTNEVLPLYLVKLLTEGTALNIDTVVRDCKIDSESIDYVISEHLDVVDAETLLTTSMPFTDEQIVKIITEGSDMYGTSLGETLGEKRNLELIKVVLRNKDSINFEDYNRTEAIAEMRYELFNYLGSVLMTDAESIEIFGFARPQMSSNKLRDYEPCAEGWRRVMKWAGRNDHMYSWNEFVARHILANQDNVEDCKSDIEWLASCLSDAEEYFS